MRGEPYYVNLGGDLHLGYRRRASGGTWVARTRTSERKYTEARVSLADDYKDADGTQVLDYGQAQKSAQAWHEEQRRALDAGYAPGTRYTVAQAVEDYLQDYRVRGKAFAQTDNVVKLHIKPALGDVPVAKLTTVRIRRWHSDMAGSPGSKRGGKVREARTDADAQRRRKATANRCLTVLKAALNFAFQHDRAGSDLAWRKVRPFKEVDAPVVRFLSEAEAKHLVNLADAEFRVLLQAALCTGCRYGELIWLRAGDVNLNAQTVSIRNAKGNKPRHVFLTDDGAKFFARHCAGRPRDALLFTKRGKRPWSKSDQIRPMVEACQRARIKPAVSFNILRHTHGSWLAMRGTPLQVIAQQLGHADTRMTEKHYAHLIPGYVAQTIRANLPNLGFSMDDLVDLDSRRAASKSSTRTAS